ncbi:FxSxx-COOH cyclophane-containing RiPP peptide [Streptomyces sp. NPDC096132]|uniref:FxSxx-COOH cyclophane-containing RiPP peptide n=1 Tax=Streptomyces sp. NPDC096132 TaxID=3366075 RepID=UPI0038218B31
MATAEGAARVVADDEPEADIESPVLDLSAFTPDELAALPESVLGDVLRRVCAGSADGDPFVTGHKESA